MTDFPLPILGFAAWSGTGKTTLLGQLIPLLVQRDIRVGLVKHAHHDFDIDQPGKDSYELRKAGASEVVVASRKRIALIMETPGNHEEPKLLEALSVIQVERLDLILVEGFKHADIPKMEIHRKALNKPYFYPDDINIVALVEDEFDNDTANKVLPGRGIPRFDLNQPLEVSTFVEDFMQNWLHEREHH